MKNENEKQFGGYQRSVVERKDVAQKTMKLDMNYEPCLQLIAHTQLATEGTSELLMRAVG